MQGSWFTSQPRGDWYTRCSISDAIAAGSVPIVPLTDMEPWMPFTDILDWRAYTEVHHTTHKIQEQRIMFLKYNTASQVLVDADVAALSEHGNCTCAMPGGTVLREEHYHDRRVAGTLHTVPVKCQCSGHTFADVLQQRYPTREALLAKLQAVWRVRSVFQYSLRPDHTVVRWSEIAVLHDNDDAFTFALKALMRVLQQGGAQRDLGPVS